MYSYIERLWDDREMENSIQLATWDYTMNKAQFRILVVLTKDANKINNIRNLNNTEAEEAGGCDFVVLL